jgi:hypothetical protein
MEHMAIDPDGPAKLGLMVQVKQGFKKPGDTFQGVGNTLFEWVSKEREGDFATLRRSTLVAACAAFENLAKAFFVEWAEWDISKVEGALSKRLTLHGDELLLDERDRLFVLADVLYKDAKGKSFSEKIHAFVRDAVPEQYAGFKAEMGKVSADSFNEAFLIRNCIVHRGGKADRRLAAATNAAEGAEIDLDAKRMYRLLEALVGAGDALSSRSVFLQAVQF